MTNVETILAKAESELALLDARLSVVEAQAGITKSAPDVEKENLAKTIAALSARMESLS